jgi:signal-transduction protein with cAMP-binding, CBS, and nucleotidyltransferase domain
MTTPAADATIPRVRDLPLRPTVAVQPDTSLRDAAWVMRANDISSLVVGAPGDLIAVLTERDLTQALAEGYDARTPVASVASPDPLTVSPDTDVLDAAVVMLAAGIRHLVVARRGRVVGMLSMRDALAGLVDAVSVGMLSTALARA